MDLLGASSFISPDFSSPVLYIICRLNAGWSGRNPVQIGSDASVNASIFRIRATFAIAGDSHLNSVNKKWATTVALYIKKNFGYRYKISDISFSQETTEVKIQRE